MNARDSSLMDYAFTDKGGRYQLVAKTSGESLLKFSYLGYETKWVALHIPNEAAVIVPDVFLNEKPLYLDEVIVRDQSVTVLEDTVRFKVEYFKTGNEKTVEDLLKKIPGVNVDSEGTIKIGNREIEKLMVDGDDLLEKGYRVLSKNMPAYPIAEVEVLKHFANNHLLKGIEESDKVALNLKLDDQFKSVWFGNVDGGLGNSNFYELNGNLMNFGKKYKSYFLTSLNNTGFDAVGEVDHLIHPMRIDEPATVGDDERVERFLDLSPDNPDFGSERTNFNNAELVSLNNIFNPTKKLKIKTLGFFNWDEIRFARLTNDAISVSDLNFTNTEDYRLGTRKRIAFGKVDLTYKGSENTMLETSTRLSLDNFRGGSALVFNGTSTNEALKHHTSLIDQELRFTNKIADKKVLLISGRFIREEAPQDYTINRFLYDDLFVTPHDIDAVRQTGHNRMYFGGVNAHFMDRRKGGHLLELQAGTEFRLDQLEAEFSLVADEIAAELPPGYQNATDYQESDSYVKGKYRFKLKNFGVTGRVDVHYLDNQLENNGLPETRQTFFVNPGLGFDWKINARNKVRSSYSFATRNAGIRDVYGDYILTGFRSFSRGTGTLNQLRGSDIVLNYEFGSWGERFFANMFAIYSHSHNFFSTNLVIDENFVQATKILLKERNFLSVNGNLDYFIPWIGSNVKLESGYSRMTSQNRVNGSDLRDITSGSYSVGVELRSGFGGMFNYHAGTKWRSSEVKTSVRSSFVNNVSFLDLSFSFNSRFDIQAKCDRHYFEALESFNTYYFLDLTARYKIIENKLSLELEGRNLTNTDTFRNVSVSDIGSTAVEYRLLPRSVLLKVEYRF